MNAKTLIVGLVATLAAAGSFANDAFYGEADYEAPQPSRSSLTRAEVQAELAHALAGAARTAMRTTQIQSPCRPETDGARGSDRHGDPRRDRIWRNRSNSGSDITPQPGDVRPKCSRRRVKAPCSAPTAENERPGSQAGSGCDPPSMKGLDSGFQGATAPLVPAAVPGRARRAGPARAVRGLGPAPHRVPGPAAVHARSAPSAD